MHLRLLKKEARHEEVFLERYSSMLTWARNLTKNDVELAEDLVQEAFIQFILTAPSLNEINNLDGYLYGLLRNLCLSHFRRVTRNRLEQLSIYEYDSAEDGLNTVEIRDQEKARDELQKICSFVSVRKNSARTASVFILRFFHGYFASEIAAILRTSRPAVDVRLMTARKEVRAFLENPKDVKFIGIDYSLKHIFQAMPVQTTVKQDEFLAALRTVIFKFREGEHQSKEQLQDFYEEEQASPIDVGQLSHQVSCPQCLDEVNLMLKLPKLGSRFPTDAIGRDKKKNGNDDDSSGTSGDGFSKLSQKVRRVFEHKPADLRVLVNGVLQGSLKANAALNELKLNLSNNEKIEFIEVFSEQQVRLLMLNVEELPPLGANNPTVSLILSDDRSLDLHLNFVAQGAELQLVYHDPTYNQVLALSANPALLENETQPPMNKVPSAKSASENSRWNRWLDVIRGFNLSPRLVMVSVTILLLSVLLFIRFSTQTVSASDLFKRSEAAEKSLGKVTHQKMMIKRTNFVANKEIETKTIDVWKNAEGNLKVQRIYNENGEIVGVTRIADNKITTYAPKHVVSKNTLIPIASPQMAMIQRAWKNGISVTEFQKIIGGANNAKVEETADTYIVSYHEKDVNFKATLTLEKAGLRPIGQHLEYQINGHSYNYEFTETSFEVLEPNKVNPSFFEVDENFSELGSKPVE